MSPRSAVRPRARVTVRAVRPDDWETIEKLFGANGACGGCWCMTWRVPRGGQLWEQVKGAKNRRSFRKLLVEGRVYGSLALVGEEAVGWCCVGPRVDFPRLERTKALATDWDENTWAVTCFYIPAAWRRRGVGGALLREAVAVARREGARSVEAYPVSNRKDPTTRYPDAFAFTGVPAMFQRARFHEISPEGAPRPIWRRDFR